MNLNKQDKLIPLRDWDFNTFAQPHSIRTLRRWARSGLIYPKPALVGREYLVQPNAQYVPSMRTVLNDPVINSLINS